MTSTLGLAARRQHRRGTRRAALLGVLSGLLLLAGGLTSPSSAAALGHVTGQVTVKGGPGVARARVLTYDADEESWATYDSVLLTGTGSYAFDVPAGSYRVCASGQGYETNCFGQTGDDFDTATTVPVAAGQTVTASFDLLALGTLSGTVLDADGEPAAGLEVRYFDASETDEYDYEDSVTTDTDGTYELALPRGQYKLGFGEFDPDEARTTQPEFYDNSRTIAGAQTLAVSPGTHQAELDAQLDTGATISGHVAGPTSEEEREALSVTAYAKIGGEWVYRRSRPVSTTTGDYTLDGLSSGTYRVCVDDITLWRDTCVGGATVGTATDIAITAPNASAGRNLTMPRKGTISGRVLAGGQPLQDATVEAISTELDEDGTPSYSTDTSTDDTGHYTLALFPGSYVLRFSAGDAWAPEFYDDSLTASGATDFTVADESTQTADDAVLVKAASIAGTVTMGDPDDETAGVPVVATSSASHETFEAKTDSTGKYSIKGLPAGAFTVSFGREDETNSRRSAPEFYSNVHEGAGADPTPVNLSVGQARAGVNATLELGATITGKVVRADGTPVAGCPVDVAVADPYFSHRYRYTQQDGSFTVEGLGGGTITLVVGKISADDSECGFGSRYYDGDDVLGASRSSAGITTVLGQTSDAGTLIYGNSAVTETATARATITGTPNVDSLLTAHEGTWNPTPTTFSYAWLDNDSPITGATSKTFKPGSTLLGHQISVKVTAHKPGVADGSSTSVQTAALGAPSATPANTVKPTIVGTPKVGSRVTANPGTWSPADGTYTYTWVVGSSVLGTASTLTVPSSAYKKTLVLKVTATNDNPTPGKATSTGALVRAGTIAFAKVPSISGTAKVGKTLKYVAGTTTPSTTSRSYRWLRDGRSISGATHSSRTLTRSDKGHKVSLKVTYRRTGYTSRAVTTVSKKVG